MTAGLLNKAARGELALTLPPGLERDAQGRVHTDPNLEVQARITLVFTTFQPRRSASKGLEFFNAQGLRLPRRAPGGEIGWKRPTVAALLAILKHPASAGAFTYGRTQTRRNPTSPGRALRQLLPMAQWRVRVPDKYPAYLGWETYEQMQGMLQDHHAEYDRHKTRGIPRPGKALRQGLVYCGACGHTMVGQSKRGTQDLCHYLRQQSRVPVCQYVPADPLDARGVEAFFAALSPVARAVYTQAMAARQQQADQVAQAHQQPLERVRDEAALCARSFRRVAPDTRLVAAALERHGETALRERKAAEDA